MAADPASFIGRSEIDRDHADPARVAGLAALLDHDTPPWTPGMLPPLGHWLCFPPRARQSRIGEDGHPLRGEDGLLPAGSLPRRMWAGSRMRFLADIPLGSPLVRISTLTAATPKKGRSGSMLFATVRHEIAVEGAGSAAIVEEQDIVYREAAAPGQSARHGAAEAGPADGILRNIRVDPVMLFRFSALTFNAHRIHYDRDYARDVEAYPGLVVHGPYLATLLMDHFLRHHAGAPVTGFSFRALSPLFDGERFTLGMRPRANGAELDVVGPFGPAMGASLSTGAA